MSYFQLIVKLQAQSQNNREQEYVVK